MTPSWPRLAGWLATTSVSTARGRFRVRENGRERAGAFAYRAPEDWAVTADGGRGALEPPTYLLGRSDFERTGDYDRTASPVTAAEHDGRRCWQVVLEPPPHKSGRLVLLVDDATGLCLHLSNAAHDMVQEVTGLELDLPLADDLFTAVVAERAKQQRIGRLYDLCHRRPPPTPRWFPWRRGFLDVPGCRVVEADAGEGYVARAPKGSTPPESDWHEYLQERSPAVRLDHAGWSWVVATHPPVDEATARRVVEGVVEGRPYDPA